MKAYRHRKPKLAFLNKLWRTKMPQKKKGKKKHYKDLDFHRSGVQTSNNRIKRKIQIGKAHTEDPTIVRSDDLESLDPINSREPDSRLRELGI